MAHPKKYKAIATNEFRTIGIAENDYMYMVGRAYLDKNGKLTFEVPNIQVSAVAVGDKHFIAIAKEDNRVICWGDNKYSQLDVPEGLKAKAICAGGIFSIAIDLEDNIVCWGGHNASSWLKPGVKARAISAGKYPTCYYISQEGDVRQFGTPDPTYMDGAIFTDEELGLIMAYAKPGTPAPAMTEAWRAILDTPGLLQKVNGFVANSLRKAIDRTGLKYHLILEPDWDPNPELGMESHKRALAEFNKVYNAKLAELSVGDPYVSPPATYRRLRRTPDEPYPEEIAYKEGAQVYHSKRVDIVEAEKANKVEVPGSAKIPAAVSAAPQPPVVNSKKCGPFGCGGSRRTRRSKKFSTKRKRAHRV